MAAARRLAAIMFTDIAGYTSLSQTDEPGALRLLEEQESLVRPILELHRGRQVKSMGDRLLIEFSNALDAVECAVDLQRHVHERNAREGRRPLRLRVGIHLGDVQGFGGDILGDAVNIASRVEPLAEPGGICLSEPVYVQVRNKVEYPLESLGPKELKGVREPMVVYRVTLPWTAGEAPASTSNLPRIAVLPLANISPDPRDEYFADGLTEELVTVLSQIKGLRVISRTSVNQYKGTTKSVAQIGHELGADSVLEGSVRKAGDQLRIAVQLIDTRSDEHRWAQTYDRKLENVFAIQAEVAERTAGALKVELLRSEREAIREKPTTSLAAYESYLRGIRADQALLDSSSSPEALDREAEQHFRMAIREDPQFSAAYSSLASHLIGVLGTTRPAKEVLPEVRALVAKALELNANSSEAHLALANLLMQGDLDWTRAESEFQQAIALNPSDSQARFWYAYLLGVLQRFDEARKQYLASVEMDPLWLLPRANLAAMALDVGDPESCIAEYRKLSERFSYSTWVFGALAWAYAVAGRRDDALRALEPLAQAQDLTTRSWRAGVLAVLGQPAEGRALLSDWEGGRLKEYFPPLYAAMLYSIWGEKDRALALLERDCREGDRVLWNLYQLVQFDSIRDDPRFVALLRELRLPITLRRPRWASPYHS